MDEFILSKRSHFILYGAASLGSVLYKKLKQHGANIDAYIDQRAEEMHELMGLPVYGLTEVANHLDVKNAVVIVSVKNVFEHTRIAAQLSELGFHNLLFKPYPVLQGKGTAEECLINMWYEKLMAGDLPDEDVSIICTQSVRMLLSDENDYILMDQDDTVIISVPLTCIFQKVDKNTNEDERNVLCYFPHIQFFRYLQGDMTADISYYMDYCKKIATDLGSFEITEAWENNVLRNRTEIFDKMNQAYNFKRDFFTTGAPHAEWNAKGYFNIDNGQHRAAFMVSKELMFLPVKMSRSDMIHWINTKKVDVILDKLQTERIDELPAPIEHPKFYEYPCKSSLFFQKLIFKITEILCRVYYQSPLDNYFNGKKVYLSLNDWGLLSRFFRRCDAEVYVNDREYSPWNVLLDDLFYMNGRNLLTKMDIFDIGVWTITSKEMIANNEISAKHRFYIIPEKNVDMRETNGTVVHCGIVGQEKMCVIYQEATNV